MLKRHRQEACDESQRPEVARAEAWIELQRVKKRVVAGQDECRSACPPNKTPTTFGATITGSKLAPWSDSKTAIMAVRIPSHSETATERSGLASSATRNLSNVNPANSLVGERVNRPSAPSA